MLNQKELAQILGVTPQHLSTIASGRSDASKALAKKIAKKTDTDPALWVFGKSEDRKMAISRLRNGGMR